MGDIYGDMSWSVVVSGGEGRYIYELNVYVSAWKYYLLR